MNLIDHLLSGYGRFISFEKTAENSNKLISISDGQFLKGTPNGFDRILLPKNETLITNVGYYQ